MKKKRLVLFGAVLLLLMVGSAFATLVTVWYDNFNDNSLGGMWTMLHHGFAESLEVNQHIEMYVYTPSQGEDWVSTGLQLVNNGWIPFDTDTSVIIDIPYYWNVQSVNLVLTNSIYNPMSAHRRYIISWVNHWVPSEGREGVGDIWVYEQIGTTTTTLAHFYQTWRSGEGGHYGVPYYSHSPMAFVMNRDNANTVSFWLGENDNGQGTWYWTRLCYDTSYSLGTNYPDYIFDTYNTVQHPYGYSAFDNFYIYKYYSQQF
jgi:hypothetical protein